MASGIKTSRYTAAAVVLKSLDYGDSDRIVTFYTEGFGKVKGIAKGARRSRRRFVNSLEDFSLTSLVFSKKRPEGLALIEACDVRNHYPGIRADLRKALTAAYLTELVDRFTLEEKKNDGLFLLLVEFFDLLEKEGFSDGVVRIFELRLLKLSGYDPVLDRCVGCNTALKNMTNIYFDPVAGGIRCGCDPRAMEAYPLTTGTVKLLLLGKTMDVGKLPRLLFSERFLEESRRALAPFIQRLVGKELKSLKVLNEVERLAL
jgi:DNA repair protein RecO (recombination protein O)